jgi:hypothetical protein
MYLLQFNVTTDVTDHDQILDGACGAHGDTINVNTLFGKLEGKRLLWRVARRWEDNIKVDLKDVECDDVNSFHLAQDKNQYRTVVNTVMNLSFHKRRRFLD